MIEAIIQLTINGLLIGGVYALISIGLTLIFGVTRVINFAHGEFLMIAMYGTYWAFYFLGFDPYLAIMLVAPFLFVVGLICQRAIIRPILNAPPLAQIFATFGLSIGLQNLFLLLFKGDYRTVHTSYQTSFFQVGPFLVPIPWLISFGFATLITILLFYYLKKTYFGKAMRAVAHDRGAAMLMGIDVHKVYFLAFGMGSACVGVAGAILLPMYPAFPTVGASFVLASFVIVVLGGLGNMMGAFWGGLIIGLVETFSGFFIAPQLKEGIYYLIFILMLLFKPSGLLGVVGAEEMGLK